MIEYVDDWSYTYNKLKYIPEDITLTLESKLVAWTRPNLTSNGTMGGGSCACDDVSHYGQQEPYLAFNGAITGNNGWQNNAVDLGTYYWITFYNPHPLKISGFQIYNGGGNAENIAFRAGNYIIYGSNDNSDWVQISQGTNTKELSREAWDYIDVDVDTNYKYIRFSFQPTDTVAMMIGEIEIDAQEERNVLTLKAGSRLLRQDLTYTNLTSDVVYGAKNILRTGENFIFSAYSSGTMQGAFLTGRMGSGGTLPEDKSTYDFFFLTTTNAIYLWSANQNNWVVWGVAYPLGIFNIDDYEFQNIKQVFNGFGFMGSTFYMNPGVQYMLYTDGENKEITVETLQTYTFDSSFSGTAYIVAYEDTTLGMVTSNKETQDQGYVLVASCSITSGRITSMTPSDVGKPSKVAQETDIVDYPAYLANLLIMQYHDKPKAIATIKALGKIFPISLILSVRDAFDIETAVGKQLDILAKYLGTDRYYINTSGRLVSLDDDSFRILLQLKAIANNTNCSHYDIDMALYNFFGTSVHAESSGNMEMTYFIPGDASQTIIAAIQKDCLPRPMGVGVRYVIIQSKKFFGFVTYQNQFAVYKTGFRTYDNPTKEGEMLTYNKVLQILGE